MDNEKISVGSVALFILKWGHKPDDAFLEEVNAKIRTNEEGFKELSPEEQKSVAKAMCAYGMLLTSMMKQAAQR